MVGLPHHRCGCGRVYLARSERRSATHNHELPLAFGFGHHTWSLARRMLLGIMEEDEFLLTCTLIPAVLAVSLHCVRPSGLRQTLLQGSEKLLACPTEY